MPAQFGPPPPSGVIQTMFCSCRFKIVKKWLKAPSDVGPKNERQSARGKLTDFESTLAQALRFAQIQSQGYRGGYSAVTDYIKRWRTQADSSPTKADAVRCTHAVLPGARRGNAPRHLRQHEDEIATPLQVRVFATMYIMSTKRNTTYKDAIQSISRTFPV